MAGKDDTFDGSEPTLLGVGAEDDACCAPTQESDERGPTGVTGQSTPEGGGGAFEDEIEAALNLVGRVIGDKYRLERLIGQGGMGAVYEAQHLTIGSKVAIKVLFPERRQRDSLARFQREAQAAGTIGHVNIVKVYDLDKTEDGLRYLVMDFVDGRSLADIIAHEGKMELGRVIAITEQVLEALAAAHENNIVHRDIKPENVMISEIGGLADVVKVLDFGISKIKPIEPDAHGLTLTGTVLGTPMYMAPEQARGEPDIDFRIDLYAVGVMMFVMLTGKPPFQASNYNALLAKILTEPPPPIKEVKPDMDARLASVVDKAIATEREQRFSSAREFIEALSSQEVFKKESTFSAGAKDSPRGGWLWGGMVAAAVLVIGVVAIIVTGGLSSESDHPVMGGAEDNSLQGNTGAQAGSGERPSKTVAATNGADAGQEDGGAVEAGPSKMITVKVSVVPQGAKIWLGGLSVEGNPVDIQYLRTDEELAIKAAAKGYASYNVPHSRTEDIDLDIVLEPLAGRPVKRSHKAGHKRGDFKLGPNLID